MKNLARTLFLGFSFFTSIAFASSCDNKPLYIYGPDHYQYTIRLSHGTIGRTDDNVQIVEHQIASPSGASWNLFSAKGTRGNVRGTLIVENLDTRETVTIPFLYYDNTNYRPSLCEISPHLEDAEIGSFQVQAKGTDQRELFVKIREFR